MNDRNHGANFSELGRVSVALFRWRDLVASLASLVDL
jgi:hypothetical protein